MPQFRKIVGIILISLILTSVVSQGGDQIPVVVVVHPGVVVDVMTRNELRAIFAMRRNTWEDGTPVRVFVLPDENPFHRFFCKKILKIYPHQLRRIWDRNIFSGTGQAPMEVGNIREMRARIAETIGAIGYVPDDLVDDALQRVEVP